MTSETYQDYDRISKGAKRPIRPKLLKLTDVTIPHRNKKKTKVKSKDRSQSSVRDRIYDDPAYTDDISHLANPIRRSSISGKSEFHPPAQTTGGGSLGKRSKTAKDFLQYAKQGKGRVSSYEQDGSSSSDNMPPDPGKSVGIRGRSLERHEKSPKKREKRERSAKQKRNLSLDNSVPLTAIATTTTTTVTTTTMRKTLERSSDASPFRQPSDAGCSEERSSSYNRVWGKSPVRMGSCAAPDTSKATTAVSAAENDEAHSVRSSSKESFSTKMQIGRKFLKGEIGIKSFNYYLLKEGLKTSKKFVEKQRNSLAAGLTSKKHISRSEENIYEEIYFKERPSDVDVQQMPHNKSHSPVSQHRDKEPIYPDCELCMQQCIKENCEYCYDGTTTLDGVNRVGGREEREARASVGRQTAPLLLPRQIQERFGSLGRHTDARSYTNHKPMTTTSASATTSRTINRNDNSSGVPPTAHILEFQSYNPNNPGVYKIETTPVAITGEYNPILQFQQPEAAKQQQHASPHVSGLATNYKSTVSGALPPMPKPRRTSKMTAGGSVVTGGIVTGQQQLQQFLMGLSSGHSSSGAASAGIHTKSSSSSDSLQHQQQLHKFNTMARLEAQSVGGGVGDPLYGAGYIGGMHPLMYASSRPIGGSQILVDPYEQQRIHKSDSKASIFSEYSFRSSDNSNQRNFRYGGEVSDSSLGDSLFSYSTTTAKRYFGSSESCRFAFECRRCSFDGGGEKCSFSDNCRYECRNCDCSSSYFSSDFDDQNYVADGTGTRKDGIPRGTSNKKPQYDYINFEGLDRKQNKYAQDFFKHVNDVKRSIYQAESQKGGAAVPSDDAKQAASSQQQQIYKIANKYNQCSTMGGRGRQYHGRGSPFRSPKIPPAPPPSIYSTLPLAKERSRSNSANLQPQPTPAPRPSIQQPLLPASLRQIAPIQQFERREYTSLDRSAGGGGGGIHRNLTTGAIPKTPSHTTTTEVTLEPASNTTSISIGQKVTSNSTTKVTPVSTSKQSPRQSPKVIRISDSPLGLQEQSTSVGGGFGVVSVQLSHELPLPKRNNNELMEMTSKLDPGNKRETASINQATKVSPPSVNVDSGRQAIDEQSKAKPLNLTRKVLVIATATPMSPPFVGDSQKPSMTEKIQTNNANANSSSSQQKIVESTSPRCFGSRCPSVQTKVAGTVESDNNNERGEQMKTANNEQAATTADKDQVKGNGKFKLNGGVGDGTRMSATPTKTTTTTTTTTINAIEDEDDDVFYDARSEDSAGGGRRSVNSGSGNGGSSGVGSSSSPSISKAGGRRNRENCSTILEFSANKKENNLEPGIATEENLTETNTTKDTDNAVVVSPLMTLNLIEVSEVGGGGDEYDDNAVACSVAHTTATKQPKSHSTLSCDTCLYEIESETFTAQSPRRHCNTPTTPSNENTPSPSLSTSPVPAPRETLRQKQRSPSPSTRPRGTPTKTQCAEMLPITSTTEETTAATTNKQVPQADESENPLHKQQSTLLVNETTADGDVGGDACADRQTSTLETSTFAETTAATALPADTHHNVAEQEPLATMTMRKSSITISVTPTPPDEQDKILEAVAGCDTTNELSRDSDITGVVVAVATNRNTKTAISDGHQPTKRPPLYRQDYSCLDSSEAASDDSHLTRDSCRSSQNDELSSSAPDKIDISNLPLPALPVKKRRSRSRASHQTAAFYHDNGKQNEAHNTVNSVTSTPSAKTTTNTSSGPLSSGQQRDTGRSLYRQSAAKRRDSLEASSTNFNEKLDARKMHYHAGATTSASGHKPSTYLFGENRVTASGSKKFSHSNNDEIFLNKSGWVQVNPAMKRINDENSPGGSHNRRSANYNHYEHQNGSAKNTIRVIQIDNSGRAAEKQQGGTIYAVPKTSGSKIEELISRSEARRNCTSAQRNYLLKPGYKIVDPQIASILNERPGFLPVKAYLDAESPPPVTPILSPPPAFQDSKGKYSDRRPTIAAGLNSRLQNPSTNLTYDPAKGNINININNGNNNKGMVFSRSFEYDNRKPSADTYIETFSRSFDCNLSDKPPPPQRDRSPNFSNLTGNSPNYLSKKDSLSSNSNSNRSRDNSPKYQQQQQQIQQQQQQQQQLTTSLNTTAYLNTSVKEAPPMYSSVSSSVGGVGSGNSSRNKLEKSKSQFDRASGSGRSRKAQFSRLQPSCPPPSSVGISRFRSFDTAISQRLNSCDSGARSDLSNDELDNEEDETTEFLTANYHNPSPYKQQRQRSLTPDRNDSHSSSSSLRKQRSLTPESRSLTPEDRRRKGSQVSLGSRQNSSSRSNTLERKQKFEDKSLSASRSSSSSSYSGRGGDHDAAPPLSAATHRRSTGRSSKTSDEHRIRRSRSLQLTERSPNRSHKMVVCVGPQHSGVNQAAPIYHQSAIRGGSGGSGVAVTNFPPTIRTTANNQPLIVNSGHRIIRPTDIDKSRSFDLDYGTAYNNQNVPNRLDFDKSRSFDDNYRETSNNNGSSNVSGMRYLHADQGHGLHKIGRKSSPAPKVGGGHSPQSSGSSSTNLGGASGSGSGGGGSAPRQTSPQNYGTRLCDHELTYDMLRRSLDRSPIMDFSRDYDIPQSMKTRETINAGGNSELNFLGSERIYDHPTTIKRPHNQSSPSGSNYSLDRIHNSRDSLTPDSSNEFKTIVTSDERLRSEYLYRQQQQQRSQNHHQQQQQGPNRGSSVYCTAKSCTFWPHCGACNNVNKPDKSSGARAVSHFVSFKLNPKTKSIVKENHAIGEVMSSGVVSQHLRCSSDRVIPVMEQPTNSVKVSVKCKSPPRGPKQYRDGSNSVVFLTKSMSTGTRTGESGTSPATLQQSSTTIAVKPSVISLTNTSMVFLGDCEMPITRERNYHSSPTASGNSSGNGRYTTFSRVGVTDGDRQSSSAVESKHLRTSKQMSITTICSSDLTHNNTFITTAGTVAFNRHNNNSNNNIINNNNSNSSPTPPTNVIEHRKRQRSISLPDILNIPE